MRISNMWDRPDFYGPDQLEELLPKLETASFRPIMVDGVAIEGFQAVKSDQNGQVYCLPTERYEIVQNKDVIIPFARALVDSGIEFNGSIRQYGGRMTATINVVSEKYSESQKVLGEAYGMAITLRNSYNCKVRFGGELDFIRLICKNGMVGTVKELAWQMYHTISMDEASDIWGNFLDRILEGPALLKPTIERAKSLEIKTSEVPTLLYGVGFGKRLTDKIFEAINGEKLVQTGFDVYNAGTQTFSHADNGDEKLDTQRENLAKCNQIMTGDWQKLLDSGAKIKEAIEEAEKERKRKRDSA